MRNDMAKVVTERPRRGHSNPSKKWGRRFGKNEFDAEDHGPTRAPIARHHQYGWNSKEFSDLLGPLRRYLRKRVGRPWNKLWSEISRTLDNRSLSGQHIFDHIPSCATTRPIALRGLAVVELQHAAEPLTAAY